MEGGDREEENKHQAQEEEEGEPIDEEQLQKDIQ